MTTEQRAVAAKKAVMLGCEKLLQRDLMLLAIGAHEQAICHRLAVYFEPFSALNVDCEYNRQRVHPKSIRGGRIKPDILIHKRIDNRFNIMVLEAKARAATSARDEQKLEAMLAIRGMYRYALGVYLHVENKRSRILKTGQVKLSLRWHGSDDVCEMVRHVADPILHEIAGQLD
ncbi:hypothetical protein [Bradyrhizobium japonicum]|uniref:hypothetical protein n=1 Tax=Bradyrhizobium japonicum TaxID=375 RepID=UPI0027148F1F|nr:hypothetical protein [Bradyrhizobium japonicum]WLB53911.1 hypothetical protein QIH94_43035 [Bradyrhizobium japonicum]WLB64216.1 hypothetical protein QIH96_02755 [Bradyrhizobium japonicum]